MSDLEDDRDRTANDDGRDRPSDSETNGDDDDEQAKIFPLVAKTSDRLQTNPQEAQQYLEKLKAIVPSTIDSLKINKEKLEEKKNELETEGEAIQRNINSLQQAQNSLRSTIDSLNASKYSLQTSLDSANSALSRAESDKRRAEREKENAVTGTVAGGVGAVVLGIFFPPSLAVTVPAVAAGGSISISNANKEIDSCRDRISSIRGSIAEKERQISSANNDIATNQCRIAEYEQSKQQQQQKLGEVKKGSVFMQKADYFFGELKSTVQCGQNRANRLHSIVERANQEEQYTLLDSRGVKLVVRSFAAAWEEVSKAMKNDQEGFMKITFVEVPHLEPNCDES